MTDLVAPACDHSVGCITCGDEAVAMRVVRLEEDTGLATCAAGDEQSIVEIELVAPVEPGDAVLVHAGVALQTLAPDEAA